MDPLSIAAAVTGFVAFAVTVLDAFDKLPRDNEISLRVGLIRREIDDITEAVTQIDYLLEPIDDELRSVLAKDSTCGKLRRTMADCTGICRKLADQLVTSFPDVRIRSGRRSGVGQSPHALRLRQLFERIANSSRIKWRGIIPPILVLTHQELKLKREMLGFMLNTLNFSLTMRIFQSSSLLGSNSFPANSLIPTASLAVALKGTRSSRSHRVWDPTPSETSTDFSETGVSYDGRSVSSSKAVFRMKFLPPATIPGRRSGTAEVVRPTLFEEETEEQGNEENGERFPVLDETFTQFFGGEQYSGRPSAMEEVESEEEAEDTVEEEVLDACRNANLMAP